MAMLWHTGQDRKYSETPYISHPIAVMEIVREVSDNETMLMTAVLHDVIEDNERVTDELVRREFGGDVADLVGWLTDVSKPEDGNRSVRKRIDREHTAASPAAAKTIKLADLIHNTESITKCDPDFAVVYMHEKALLLEVLKDGDSTLWNRAHLSLQSYQQAQLQKALE